MILLLALGFFCCRINQSNKNLPVSVKDVFSYRFPEFRDQGINMFQYRWGLIHGRKRPVGVVLERYAYRCVLCPVIIMNSPIRFRERNCEGVLTSLSNTGIRAILSKGINYLLHRRERVQLMTSHNMRRHPVVGIVNAVINELLNIDTMRMFELFENPHINIPIDIVV